MNDRLQRDECECQECHLIFSNAEAYEAHLITKRKGRDDYVQKCIQMMNILREWEWDHKWALRPPVVQWWEEKVCQDI